MAAKIRISSPEQPSTTSGTRRERGLPPVAASGCSCPTESRVYRKWCDAAQCVLGAVTGATLSLKWKRSECLRFLAGQTAQRCDSGHLLGQSSETSPESRW